MRERFCEVILICDSGVLFILSSGGHFVGQSRTICAIFIEGILRNISMVLKKWTRASGG